MAGGSGLACAAALPAAAVAAGVAGCPAAGGAGEGVPAVAAPGGLEGEGDVCAAVAPVAGSLTGLLCGPELQAAARTRRTSRFIRAPDGRGFGGAATYGRRAC